MKSKETRRKEALARLSASVYDNSKAKRTGSANEEQWNIAKQKALGLV